MKETSTVCKDFVSGHPNAVVNPSIRKHQNLNKVHTAPSKAGGVASDNGSGSIDENLLHTPPSFKRGSSLHIDDSTQVIYFSPTINKQIPSVTKSTMIENLEGRYFVPHRRRYSVDDMSKFGSQIVLEKGLLNEERFPTPIRSNNKLKSLSTPDFDNMTSYSHQGPLSYSYRNRKSKSSYNIDVCEYQHIIEMNHSILGSKESGSSVETTPLHSNSRSRLCQTESKGSFSSEIKLLCPPTITESVTEHNWV